MHHLFTLVRLGPFKPISIISLFEAIRYYRTTLFWQHTETKKCHERIYGPEQWDEVIKSARKRNPFTVTPVSQNNMVMQAGSVL